MSVQLHSQSYIVPNGVTSFGFGPLGYQTRVIQNPPSNDDGVFGFAPQGGSAFLFSTTVDQGIRVFFVSPSDPISLQPILSQSYTELLPGYGYIFNNQSPFIVGLYSGFGPPENGIYNDPVFGWAALVNNNGVIELLGGALEYGGGGIIAGTQTILPVPEPGTIALVALGSLLLGFRRSRSW